MCACASINTSSSSFIMAAASSTSKYCYPLNYDWKHPWPRAPIPANEDARLAELLRYKILDSEPDEKFEKLCRIACKEMKCPIAAVSFLDKQKQWFKANSGLTQKQIPRDVALCAHTIMHPKRALIVEDTCADERFQHNPLVTRASAVRFYAGVPITSPNGFCIGSVFVFDVKTHENVDAKILHKIAAKVLKYMDERLKNLNANGGLPAASSVPATPDKMIPTSATAAPLSSRSAPAPAPAPKPQSVAAARPQSTTRSPSRDQPAGETSRREPTAYQAAAPVKAITAAGAAALPPAAPVVAATQQQQAPVAAGALVRTETAVQPAQSTALEVGGAGGGAQGMGNMGAMLMNLLARTTETQQQLAAQQGVMFETLGQHSSQLEHLNHSMSHLEQRLEAVRLKQVAKQQQQR